MSLWSGGAGTYQRRTARPVALLVSVLAVGAIITWSTVLLHSSDTDPGAGGPPPPPRGAPAPTTLERDALQQVAPTAPGTVRIRVLNGGGQRGQANLVASQLGELGFTEAGEPTNDPLYPDNNLACRGNIRFGPAGAAAARTVALVLPCVPLVRDTRADDSVDVAIGTSFGEVNPSKDVRDVLDQLAGPAGQGDDAAGPAADQELLAKASDARC